LVLVLPYWADSPLSPLSGVTHSHLHCESVEMSTLFAIGMPGLPELMIILFILLLLFGGARLPGLMRNLGRSAKEFQKGIHGSDDDEYDQPPRVTSDEEGGEPAHASDKEHKK
jgi:sec-independent protein translocase protein TatA